MREKEYDEYRVEVQITMAKIRYIANQLAQTRNDPRLDQIRVLTKQADRIWKEFERCHDGISDPDEWFGLKRRAGDRKGVMVFDRDLQNLGKKGYL